jgi:hypothetical protein
VLGGYGTCADVLAALLLYGATQMNRVLGQRVLYSMTPKA